VIIPVAVEKLAPEKSAKIKMRQEALQRIFFDHLDIFYPGISTSLRKKGVFQQSPLFPTVNSLNAVSGPQSTCPVTQLIGLLGSWQIKPGPLIVN
jgi:hypothetical protein